jgi:hypothetical protein
MEVIARYPGDSKFEVAGRNHRVICDQPLDNRGSDEGMSPPEFLLASLAAAAYHSQPAFTPPPQFHRLLSTSSGFWILRGRALEIWAACENGWA